MITKPETTLAGLEASLKLLGADGILSVVIYPGHEGGDEEAQAVKVWTKGLDSENYEVGLEASGEGSAGPQWVRCAIRSSG